MSAHTDLEKAYIASGSIDYILESCIGKTDPDVMITKAIEANLKIVADYLTASFHDDHPSCDGSCTQIRASDRFSLVTPDTPIATPIAVAYADGTELTDSYFYRGVRIEIGEKQDGSIIYCAIVDDTIRTSAIFREIEMLIDDSIPDRLERHDDKQVAHK